MPTVAELIAAYDRLGEASYSSAHDFTSRQRRLEDWAALARRALAEIERRQPPVDLADAQPPLLGVPGEFEAGQETPAPAVRPTPPLPRLLPAPLRRDR